MRANKHFCVIVYDTPSAKRRHKMVKTLELYGKRINYSVYECMLTPTEEKKILNEFNKIAIKGMDQIAIYRICVNCFTKITYIPPQIRDADIITII